MVESVTGKFALAELQEDGLSLEAHLINFWRQSRQMPSQLEVLPFPLEIAHIWEWWVVLAKTRPVGMEPGHITYTEIYNWQKLHGIGITEFEVRCLIILDSVYMDICRKAQAKKAATPS